MSLCNVLWKEDKALPFQFIVVGAGISTFISPFIAQPFINSQPSAPTSTSSESCVGHQDGLSHGMSSELGLVSNATVVISEAETFSDIKWPFIVVGSTTLPAALAFFYFYFTRPKRQDSTDEVEISFRVASPHDDVQKPLLNPTPIPLSRHNKCVVTFRILVILLNIPVFGLLLTFADLLTTIGMASPLCLTAVEASYFNTVLWGSAMIGRAVSAVVLICVPMALQLLFNSVALVGVGLVLVIFYYGNSLVLWLGTAGVALFITPAMPGFIAWSGDFVPITPFFMSLCLCAAGVGEMLLPFLGGQLMAMYGSWYMMVFSLMTTIAMLILFLLASYVARKIGSC